MFSSGFIIISCQHAILYPDDEQEKYGQIFGNVLSQSVPPYGGIIVTFKLKISGEQGKGNPFKQGSPIIIEAISSKDHYPGTVVMVR